jgi:twitching motility protein PilJ
MSFMDKITSRPRDARADHAAHESQFDDVITAYPDEPAADTMAPRATQVPAPDTRSHDSSIISEVTPSEMAGDFSETRLQDPVADTPSRGAALPLIGHLGAAQQQRVLFGLVGAGLLGLVMATVLALSSANRSGEQVGAIGQALMESQRLAKSATQAMIGTPQAFPEVKESAEVLSRNVRAMAGGDENLPPAPAAVQEAVDPLLPLVGRAAAEGADRCGSVAAPDQQAVRRPAGYRRDRVLAQIAAGRLGSRTVGDGPTGDVDAAHRQECQRVHHR